MTELEETLSQRGKTHGDFATNSQLAQELKKLVKKNISKKAPSYVLEAIDMICHKLARLSCGDTLEPDHWKDIAGYSWLVYEQLIKGSSKPVEKKLESDLGIDMTLLYHLLDQTLAIAASEVMPKEQRTLDYIMTLLPKGVSEDLVRERMHHLSLTLDKDGIVTPVS